MENIVQADTFIGMANRRKRSQKIVPDGTGCIVLEPASSPFKASWTVIKECQLELLVYTINGLFSRSHVSAEQVTGATSCLKMGAADVLIKVFFQM